MHLICTCGYALLQPVDQAVMHLSLEWEIKVLNQPGQIEHSVASGFLLLQHFLEGSYVAWVQ